MDELDILLGLRAPNGSAEKRQAADALLQMNTRKVFRLAYRHGVAFHECEDVLQNVVEAIIKNAGRVRKNTRRAARAWISKVIRSRIMDALRRQHYWSIHCTSLDGPEDLDDADCETKPLPKALIHVDLALGIEMALEDFAEDHPEAAEVLVLQAEGYPISEIAKKIGRAEPATTTYLHTCRKRLRRYLEE